MIFLNWLPCELAVGHTQLGTFSKTYGFVIANVSVEIMIHSVSEANVLELLEICFPKLGQIFHCAPLKLLNVVKLYCHICFIMTQETNSLIVLSFMNSAINLFLNYCNHYSMFKYFYGDILRYITICIIIKIDVPALWRLGVRLLITTLLMFVSFIVHEYLRGCD